MTTQKTLLLAVLAVAAVLVLAVIVQPKNNTLAQLTIARATIYPQQNPQQNQGVNHGK